MNNHYAFSKFEAKLHDLVFRNVFLVEALNGPAGSGLVPTDCCFFVFMTTKNDEMGGRTRLSVARLHGSGIDPSIQSIDFKGKNSVPALVSHHQNGDFLVVLQIFL